MESRASVRGVTAAKRPEDATREQLAAYTAADVDTFTAAQITALGDKVQFLSDKAVGSLDAKQVDALCAAQVGALGDDIAFLAPAALASLDGVETRSYDIVQATDLLHTYMVTGLQYLIPNLLRRTSWWFMVQRQNKY